MDILLVLNIALDTVLRDEELDFIKKYIKTGVTLITVYIGIFVIAYTGVLNGKKAMGSRALVLIILKKKFPKVEWLEKRWV